MRKLFIATVAALALSAGAAVAQTPANKALIDAAKAEGVVGEQADGYLGFRVPSSDEALNRAVRETNAGRRAGYARAATAGEGVTAEVAGAEMFQTRLYPRIESGQWYRNAEGRWVQR